MNNDNDQQTNEPIDFARLAELLGTDDARRTSQHIGLFVEMFPDLLRGVEAAIVERDATALHHAAHKAKGAANSAAAPGLVQLLRGLEVDATQAKWDDFQERFGALKSEFAAVERLCATLGADE